MAGLARVPGEVALTAALTNLAPIRRASMAVASLTIDPIPDALIRSWTAPLRDAGVRRDLVKVARGIDARHTLQAAERLRGYDRPVLLAWGARDKLFPPAHAERLRDTFPQARLELIEDARTCVPLDAPDRLASLVAGFAATTAAQQS